MLTVHQRLLPVVALAFAACRTDSTGTSIQASLQEADDPPRFSAWSAPVNLGPPINTAFADAGSFISKDGLSVYISSTRPDGCGGFDIWVFTRERVDEVWGEPANLGCDVNSSGLDAAPVLTIDGHRLYFHLEIIEGVDRSGIVNVSPANGIDNRLTKVLIYLDTQYPEEGWSRFLEDGAPKWSQIAVGGHSLGAAQAALIGTLRHVNRVVMLSGPIDARVAEEPDAWIAIGETPAAKYFGLFHQREPVAQWIPRNLSALDLDRFGEPVVLELAEPPYGGTHILVTDLEPTGGYVNPNPHRSIALDVWTPLGADGTPRLRDAWRYMLGERNDADDNRTGDAP